MTHASNPDETTHARHIDINATHCPGGGEGYHFGVFKCDAAAGPHVAVSVEPYYDTDAESCQRPDEILTRVPVGAVTYRGEMPNYSGDETLPVGEELYSITASVWPEIASALRAAGFAVQEWTDHELVQKDTERIP